MNPVFDVHLKGAFHVTQPAWVKMREQGYGRIISTSSAAGHLRQLRPDQLRRGEDGPRRLHPRAGRRRARSTTSRRTRSRRSRSTRMTETILGGARRQARPGARLADRRLARPRGLPGDRPAVLGRRRSRRRGVHRRVPGLPLGRPHARAAARQLGHGHAIARATPSPPTSARRRRCSCPSSRVRDCICEATGQDAPRYGPGRAGARRLPFRCRGLVAGQLGRHAPRLRRHLPARADRTRHRLATAAVRRRVGGHPLAGGARRAWAHPSSTRACGSSECARAGVPPFLNMVGLVLAGGSIMRFGTPEQQARHLRPTLAADEVWCQLFSEPGAGSDLGSLATRAVARRRPLRRERPEGVVLAAAAAATGGS